MRGNHELFANPEGKRRTRCSDANYSSEGVISSYRNRNRSQYVLERDVCKSKLCAAPDSICDGILLPRLDGLTERAFRGNTRPTYPLPGAPWRCQRKPFRRGKAASKGPAIRESVPTIRNRVRSARRRAGMPKSRYFARTSKSWSRIPRRGGRFLRWCRRAVHARNHVEWVCRARGNRERSPRSRRRPAREMTRETALQIRIHRDCADRGWKS